MEILKTIFIIVAVFSIIFTVVFIWAFVANLRQAIGIQNTADSLKNNVKIVYVEQIGTMFHMYDKFTDRFICQASTESELWKQADAMFPNIKLLSTTNDTMTGNIKL